MSETTTTEAPVVKTSKLKNVFTRRNLYVGAALLTTVVVTAFAARSEAFASKEFDATDVAQVEGLFVDTTSAS